MNSKSLFKKFTQENRRNLPFSLQFEWWDEVVSDHWDVAVVANGEQVLGIWPYAILKKGVWTMVENPHFTPYSGPFIIYPENQKSHSRISYENKLHQALLDQLPNFSDFNQNFHFACINTLTFLWNGFKDCKRYTYLLDLTQDETLIWSNLKENIRRQIKKAEKNLQLESHFDAELIEKMLKGSYQNQAANYPGIPTDYYQRIVNYLQKYQSGKIFKAIDQQGNCHSSICCVWDQNNAYYLIGGSLDKYKNSGAVSLLLWEAIKESKKQGKLIFNFEGSVVPGIEKFLRSFGGELLPYSSLRKMNSKSLQMARNLKK